MSSRLPPRPPPLRERVRPSMAPGAAPSAAASGRAAPSSAQALAALQMGKQDPAKMQQLLMDLGAQALMQSLQAGGALPEDARELVSGLQQSPPPQVMVAPSKAPSMVARGARLPQPPERPGLPPPPPAKRAAPVPAKVSAPIPRPRSRSPMRRPKQPTPAPWSHAARQAQSSAASQDREHRRYDSSWEGGNRRGGGQPARLEDVLRDIPAAAREQAGSQLIVRVLSGGAAEAAAEETQAVVAAMMEHAVDLACDDHGCHAVEALLDALDAEQQDTLVETFRGQVGRLIMDKHGFRVMQTAMKRLPDKVPMLVAEELLSDIWPFIDSPHASSVAQLCVEQLPADYLSIAAAALDDKAEALACHQYGCRVVLKLVESCRKHDILDQLDLLLERLSSSAPQLARDKYGNLVVHCLLDSGRPEDRLRVIEAMRRDAADLAKDKVAFNVLERCIKVVASADDSSPLADERGALARALLCAGRDAEEPEREALARLAQDDYGHLAIIGVVRHLAGSSDRELIRRCLVSARRMGCFRASRHRYAIEERLQDAFGEAFFDESVPSEGGAAPEEPLQEISMDDMVGDVTAEGGFGEDDGAVAEDAFVDEDPKRIRLTGLPPDCVESDITDYFSQFGEVQDVSLDDVQHVASVGFADDAAAEAVLAQDEHRLMGQLISVSLDAPSDCEGERGRRRRGRRRGGRPRNAAAQPGEEQCKLFLNGLPISCTRPALVAYFERFGKVADAVVMKDRKTGEPTGFSFVRFKFSDGVDAAMAAEAEGHTINGKAVTVRRAGPPAGKGGSVCPFAAKNDGFIDGGLFVGGLPQSCRDEGLVAYFSKFGPVAEGQVKMNPQSGASRGFGWVLFESPADAEAALAEYDNHRINGKWVEVKRLDSSRGGKWMKEDRRQPEGAGAPALQGANAIALPPREAPRPRKASPSPRPAPRRRDSRERREGDGDRDRRERSRRRDAPQRGGGHSIVPGKIFVGGLPPNCTADELSDHFRRYGRLADVVAMVHPETRMPRGFGFVTFEDGVVVNEVMARYMEHKIRGKWVEVKRAEDSREHPKGKGRGEEERQPLPRREDRDRGREDRGPGREDRGRSRRDSRGRDGGRDDVRHRPRQEDAPWQRPAGANADRDGDDRRRRGPIPASSPVPTAPALPPPSHLRAEDPAVRKIFVGGIPLDVPDADLREYFSRFGYVRDASVSRFSTGRSRGFGLVEFDNARDVEEVMRQYKNHYLAGQWVEVKKFDSRKSRDRRGGPYDGGVGKRPLPSDGGRAEEGSRWSSWGDDGGGDPHKRRRR